MANEDCLRINLSTKIYQVSEGLTALTSQCPIATITGKNTMKSHVLFHS